MHTPMAKAWLVCDTMENCCLIVDAPNAGKAKWRTIYELWEPGSYDYPKDVTAKRMKQYDGLTESEAIDRQWPCRCDDPDSDLCPMHHYY